MSTPAVALPRRRGTDSPETLGKDEAPTPTAGWIVAGLRPLGHLAVGTQKGTREGGGGGGGGGILGGRAGAGMAITAGAGAEEGGA